MLKPKFTFIAQNGGRYFWQCQEGSHYTYVSMWVEDFWAGRSVINLVHFQEMCRCTWTMNGTIKCSACIDQETYELRMQIEAWEESR